MTLKTLSIDEFVDSIVEKNKENPGFLRELVRDNIITGRSLKKLGDEHTTFRTEILAASRVGSGPSVAAIRRAVADSDARLAAFFVVDEETVKANQKAAQS